MGYIVPVIPFQRMNYIERDTIRVRNAFHYEGVSPVAAIKRESKEMTMDFNDAFAKRTGTVPFNKEEQTDRRKIKEEMSEWTGKGILFDVRI